MPDSKITPEWRDVSGCLCIHLDEDPNNFRLYATRLEEKYKAVLIQNLDGLDQRYWDFRVGDTTIVLHSDTFAGVSISCKDNSKEDLLRHLALVLAER